MKTRKIVALLMLFSVSFVFMFTLAVASTFFHGSLEINSSFNIVEGIYYKVNNLKYGNNSGTVLDYEMEGNFLTSDDKPFYIELTNGEVFSFSPTTLKLPNIEVSEQTTRDFLLRARFSMIFKTVENGEERDLTSSEASEIFGKDGQNVGRDNQVFTLFSTDNVILPFGSRWKSDDDGWYYYLKEDAESFSIDNLEIIQSGQEILIDNLFTSGELNSLAINNQVPSFPLQKIRAYLTLKISCVEAERQNEWRVEKPSISLQVSATNNVNNDQITATAEANSNIEYYAFSQIGDKASESLIDWLPITSPSNSITKDFKVTAAGDWFFWIKDVNGNIEVSSPIRAYSINLPEISGTILPNIEFAIEGTQLELDILLEDNLYLNESYLQNSLSDWQIEYNLRKIVINACANAHFDTESLSFEEGYKSATFTEKQITFEYITGLKASLTVNGDINNFDIGIPETIAGGTITLVADDGYYFVDEDTAWTLLEEGKYYINSCDEKIIDFEIAIDGYWQDEIDLPDLIS